MDSFEIRQKFLDFFKKHGHEIVPSSSLIPAEDPTLLFTNAGMNQFKDLFLGLEKRAYTRATSSQKCVRAGGKHNDLEEVGFTNRHLTFFEMLGNFSFGDYFKKEAIEFAWDFLTKDLSIDPKRMCVSVYKTDDEAFEIWVKDIGIPRDKIYRLGESENFWQMGDTGPCGPCTEIHIDKGASFGCKTKNCDPSCSCGRFVEIWNLVFMQYDRQADGTLKPLKQTGVDTGMGLERLCMILQDKETVYETDLFSFLCEKIESLTGVSYKKSSADIKAAFHVLCDHVRSSSLLVSDGCLPSNEGRGYVLRKIIRRAALFARKFDVDSDFIAKLAETFVDKMSPVFDRLKENRLLVANTLRCEVERFASSLDQGEQIFNQYVSKSKKEKKTKISGEQVFKLYDTYGFPPELTKVMAGEAKFTVDMAGFEKEMEKQRAQSGKKDEGAECFAFDVSAMPDGTVTKFVGYESLESKSKILFVQRGDSCAWVVTEESPFYVESGGQASDHGFIELSGKSFPVKKIEKVGGGDSIAIAVKVDVDCGLKINVGDVAHCVADAFKRKNAAKNHTATHLLQSALTKIVGPQVKQSGSLVCKDYLRFDFSAPSELGVGSALSDEKLERVETFVNHKIQEDIALKIFNTTLAEAQSAGVTAFFGEKYNPENVRVVQVPGVSAELCGGTHVVRTGEIGCFKIVSEAALAAGVRRITAYTGPRAVELFQQTFGAIKKLGEQYKVKPDEVLCAVQRQQREFVEMSRNQKRLLKEIIKANASTWADEVKDVGNIPFLFLSFDDYGRDELRSVCQEVEKKSPGFYLLVSKQKDGNHIFVGYLSKKFSDKISLKDLCAGLKKKCGISSGGSPTFVQGGAPKVDLKQVKICVQEFLES